MLPKFAVTHLPVAPALTFPLRQASRVRRQLDVSVQARVHPGRQVALLEAAAVAELGLRPCAVNQSRRHPSVVAAAVDAQRNVALIDEVVEHLFV